MTITPTDIPFLIAAFFAAVYCALMFGYHLGYWQGEIDERRDWLDLTTAEREAKRLGEISSREPMEE